MVASVSGAEPAPEMAVPAVAAKMLCMRQTSPHGSCDRWHAAQVLQQPLSTPCGHHFCKPCLDKPFQVCPGLCAACAASCASHRLPQATMELLAGLWQGTASFTMGLSVLSRRS